MNIDEGGLSNEYVIQPKYLGTVFIGLLSIISIISYFLSHAFWTGFSPFIAIAMDFICTLITLCIFAVAFFSCDTGYVSPLYCVMGFGFASVSVLNLSSIVAMYYSLRIANIGFLAKTLTILAATLLYDNKSFKKKTTLIPMSLAYTIVLIGIGHMYDGGYYTLKEFLIWFNLIVALFRLSFISFEKGKFKHRDILLGILLLICYRLAVIVEIFFDSHYFSIAGHLFHITGDLIILKEVFAVSIIYPFQRLKYTQKYLYDIRDRLQNQERLAVVGQMGNGIVHETKNYLASIKGYCELLLLDIKEEPYKNYISKIQFIANDMNKLITQYLNLSKPSESDDFHLISINEIINSIKYVLESPSFISNVFLDLDLCDDDMKVLASETMIKHIIINLSKNAVEAMKNTPSGVLTIKTRLIDDYMQLIISDNGEGISPENIEKIGTPFFTTKKTGTGLGLSNCYRFVEKCNGTIHLDSELGIGTTFTINLPVWKGK